jgi:hypothetical protein
MRFLVCAHFSNRSQATSRSSFEPKVRQRPYTCVEEGSYIKKKANVSQESVDALSAE